MKGRLFFSIIVIIFRLCRTYFGCTVNVLDGEGGSQTVQQNFSQRRYELRRGHQHIHTVTPAGRTQQTLVHRHTAGKCSQPSNYMLVSWWLKRRRTWSWWWTATWGRGWATSQSEPPSPLVAVARRLVSPDPVGLRQRHTITVGLPTDGCVCSNIFCFYVL